MMLWIGIAGLVMFSSWWMTLLIRRHAIKHQMLDHPGERSSHINPKPSGGGLAIVIAFLSSLVGLWVSGWLDSKLFAALFLGGSLVAIVGYWDDRSPLPAKVRFLVHLVAVVIAMVCLQVWTLALPWNHWLPLWINFPLTTLLMIWMVNLYNFMDGIDALAGMQAITIAMVILVIALISGRSELAVLMLLLAASSAGFLICNWPPASIFLGDIGSGFLGFQFAVLAIASETKFGLSVWVWVILLAVFFADTGVTLIRRIFIGEVWYQAHRSHAFQIMSRRWGSHLRVDLAVLGFNFIWLAPLSLVAVYYPKYGVLMSGVAALPLIWIALKVRAGDPSA